MARQATSPVQHSRSLRDEQGVLMSSGRAGHVIPALYFPVLRGDSAAGRVSIDLSLAEMPRPLLNAVMINAQAWFIPKSIHPQFNGGDEFAHSYMGEPLSALGMPDRPAPPFFLKTGAASVANSPFFRTLGIHLQDGSTIQTDIIDAFVLAYNFRLAAHSTKMERKKYFSEDAAEALAFPRAFWPSGRFSRVVPDYERALVVGSLDLDIAAGRVPIPTLYRGSGPTVTEDPTIHSMTTPATTFPNPSSGNVMRRVLMQTGSGVWPNIFGEMAGQRVTTSLADIDTARRTQAFARLRTAYAGNDPTGFQNDDVILATLMQGLSVPADMFKRPWLLDSARVPFGFNERFSTDQDALDTSVSTGRASLGLSLNIPQSNDGGTVIVTIEVLPERLDEAQSDEWLYMTDVSQLPNALRDIQNPEPVDMVLNRRIDARHTEPSGLYGYEPMNDKWNREFTRLGGVFYQADPQNPFKEQRAGIWQAGVVDPVFSADHWLAPSPFPHDVFSDTQAPAFEFVVRHSVRIVGLTQVGDVLAENNDDWDAIAPDGGVPDLVGGAE